MIGTVLDKYEVVQKVGEGGMATVYLGRHTTLNRDVAIKVLHPHLSSSTRNRKRFAREARAIERLRHENILEIYDYSGTDSSECYIVTEYIRGETLSDLMQRVGRMPSEVAATIGLKLAEALNYAHQAGILHRDLKPDNVMIRGDGTVKLMDFGIARFLDESHVTMTGALVGSPAFMSPEQAREGNLDARSDLFSLGTLLYHLVTGHLPFSGSNPSLILKNIIEGNRPHVTELAPTMSASLADLIERCMQVDREERFNSAAEIEASLQACLAEVDFDPDAPTWSTTAYLKDPDGYQERLEAVLGEVLLRNGRVYLEEGDHLAALRLFNRLLTLDEDNAEVLALVQGLHADSPTVRPRGFILLFAAGLAAIASAGMWWVGAQVADEPPGPEVPAVDAGLVDAPSQDAPGVEPPPPVPPSRAEEPVEEPTSLPPEVAPSPESGEPAVPPKRTLHRPLSLPPKVRLPKLGEPVSTEALLAVAEPAYIDIRTHQPYMAYIYEDGERIGDVRQRKPLEVTPGEHLYVLRAEGILDYELRVTVEPGGHEQVFVDELQPRPVKVVIAPDFSDGCAIFVNGEPRGTVGQLGGEVTLKEPQAENIVVLDCGDEGVFDRTFANLDTLFPTFTLSAGDQ
ncbi:MAG: serine/threonine protein kinase [Deltaproteobacteria bacterium]|nr:serine/threonine protein kinase [Deltaproteobacteria bacterium]